MSARKIRVLEMIDEAEIGGGQMHVLLLAKYLPPEVFDVTIATASRGWLVEEASKVEIKTIPIAMSNRLNVATLRDVRKILMTGNFDILHTHGGTTGFWGRVGAVSCGQPAFRIHTYHGIHYLEDSNVSRSFRYVDRVLLSFTKNVICVCKSDYDKGIAAKVVSLAKGMIIHNGIEIDRFAPSLGRGANRKRFGVEEGVFVFGNIGRLHQQKGQGILLHAFAKVAGSLPESRLLIVGEGELREELVKLTNVLGIAGFVTFLPASTDIPRFLSAIDVFVLPSLWEGQPIVLLEALAARKPAIASRVDGIVEVIDDKKNGLLVEPSNVEALASAMRHLAVDPILRDEISMNGRATISDKFSALRMAEQISRLYQTRRKE